MCHKQTYYNCSSFAASLILSTIMCFFGSLLTGLATGRSLFAVAIHSTRFSLPSFPPTAAESSAGPLLLYALLAGPVRCVSAPLVTGGLEVSIVVGVVVVPIVGTATAASVFLDVGGLSSGASGCSVGLDSYAALTLAASFSLILHLLDQASCPRSPQIAHWRHPAAPCTGHSRLRCPLAQCPHFVGLLHRFAICPYC